MRRFQPVSVDRRQSRVGRIVQRVLDRRQHQSQGRAELVTDVGKEGRLGAVDLGQRLCPAALLLIGLRIGDRGRDLSCHQANEAAIIVIKQAIWIEANNNDAGPTGLARRQDRKDRRLSGWFSPRACRNVGADD
jgi:hypothetical protein